MPTNVLETAWVSRLCAMGHAIREHLHEALRLGSAELARPVAEEGGDTIFGIDRRVEPIVERAIDSWEDECKPLLLIAEGMGQDGRRRFGDPALPLRFRLIIDPIDGTRNIMYDKRSAWFIAAVARDQGERTSLGDTFAAVLIELPTSKQVWCDTLTAGTNELVQATRHKIGSDEIQPVVVCPSKAVTLEHGFAQVTNFFPGTKVLASELMERIVAETLGSVRPGRAAVFDDQYLTTGGQMVELIVGHDRFCCDLRPLFYQILQERDPTCARGLECHPYDVAGALVARRAGVVITDGFGRELRPLLDVHSPVHWCGYANERLRRQIEPVIQSWLAEHGIVPP